MTTKLSRLMEKDKLVAIGIMSGTSCDAVDICSAGVSGRSIEQLSIEAGAYSAFPYPRSLSETLISSHKLAVPELNSLSFQLGAFFADCVVRFLDNQGIPASEIDIVGSHGHTVIHNPPPTKNPSTLQIGEASAIKKTTGIDVVSDFRAADVAAGGQGAPLVPIVDYLLFGQLPEAAALNIGGIANVTVIGDSLESTFAFDTGPGNCLIDRVVQLLSDGEIRFDQNGKQASAGRYDHHQLEMLLDHPYFGRVPPKSLDREEFGEAVAQGLIDSMKGLPGEDIIATATEFTARTIHSAFEKFVFPDRTITRVIVSGGGVHNLALLRRIEELLRPVHIISSAHFEIDPDGKEALAFAVLAALCVRGLPGNLPSATGARQPVVLGKITQ